MKKIIKNYEFEIVNNDLSNDYDGVIFDKKLTIKYRKIANNDKIFNDKKPLKLFILINIMNSLLIQKLISEDNIIIKNSIDYNSKIIHIEYEKI